jgi:protein-disulfide isomerase
MSSLTTPVSERDHVQGPADAPVTLVEYGDFECPYCGMAYPIVKQLQATMGRDLRFAFRHFPIRESHPHAEHAAEAAEAAGAQGKFWQMHDALYENQHALGDAALARYADALGLDTARFEAELRAHTHAKRVRDDFMGGVRSGVNGTPTFFINGERYDGPWNDPAAFLADLHAAAAGPSHR